MPCRTSGFSVLTGAAIFAALNMFGCSALTPKLDCVKHPKDFIGKCINISPSHAVLASLNENSIYAFEANLRDKIEGDLHQKESKDGKIGGTLDFIAHSHDLSKTLSKQNTRTNLLNQGIKNININANGRSGGDPLTIVILAADKIDTKTPVFKVRVVNKVCAGSEVWLTASTVHMHGTAVAFGSGK